jgi:hypothetical protein
MRVCFRLSDNSVVEAQSGDDGDLGVLVQNAISSGLSADEVGTKIVPDAEFYQTLNANVVPRVISGRQFFQQLAIQSVISQEEALAAVKTGTLPLSLAALVNALPSDQQFGANMLLCGATTFDRNHPMVAVLGQAFGWTNTQLDALWTAAAAL